MTEFEIAYLLNDIQVAIAAYSSMLFTMMSAFLVAGYVAAHRLSALMIALLIGIYAYAFFGTSFVISGLMTTMFGLAGQIDARAAAGSELQWHNAVVADAIPATVRPLLPPINLVMTTVIFAATLVFFFHCRRVNRKVEGSVWHPKV